MSDKSRKFVKSLIRYRAADHEENYEIYTSIDELLDRTCKDAYTDERIQLYCDKPTNDL